MMINKRLIRLLSSARKYVFGIVCFQWLSLLANCVMILSLASLLQNLFAQVLGAAPLLDAQAAQAVQATQITQTAQPLLQPLLFSQASLTTTLVVFAVAAGIRAACAILGTRMTHLVSVQVKATLRTSIYGKVLALGADYHQAVRSSEIVQVAGEGVEQLESYFGRYLPQLFYAVLAPITLFGILAFISVPTAVVLLVAVPLILVAIIAVSRMARRIFGKYWGIYTDLGANFLENLQGLTTLKIYRAEERKRQEMAQEAEDFRRVTMKVLSTQLGSITAMDFVAFGGAAVGIIVALLQFGAGAVGIAGCLTVILLSAEFFIPMRQLGSFFHIAMNGVAASDKIFALLDLPVPAAGHIVLDGEVNLMGAKVQQLTFSYAEKPVLDCVSLSIPPIGLTAVVGKSGCGKSTLARALLGGLDGYQGSIQVQVFDTKVDHRSYEVSSLAEKYRMQNITLVTADSHIFKGTVRENLLIARPSSDDQALWAALERVKLDGFIRSEDGLDTQLAEGASNLSGGQRQRLALARALLHDAPFYIFDEATSNIDVESESSIMAVISELAHEKAVLLISHRLANVVDSQHIYVLENGAVVEHGQHRDLLVANGAYASLYTAQSELENFSVGENPGAAEGCGTVAASCGAEGCEVAASCGTEGCEVAAGCAVAEGCDMKGRGAENPSRCHGEAVPHV